MRGVRICAVVLCLAASRAAEPPARIQFEEIAQKAGVDFRLKNSAAGSFHQVELMLGGVAVLDFDNDGCMDLFFTNGASLPGLKKTGPEFHNRLYRNDCQATFSDVTGKAGVAGEGYSMAAAAGDYDNDGWTDLFVTGVNVNTLYRNLGDGRFSDVTSRAGLAGVDGQGRKPWSVSAGWLDYDNDGRLDLFVSNYVEWNPSTEPRCGSAEYRLYCHPNVYRGLPNQLFHNNGDGTFSDVSGSSGIGRHTGKGMGVAFADIDGDGFTDIFVANDSVRHFLFRNQKDGTFRETGLEAGIALRDDGMPIAGMGADLRDYDNDGRPDLVVSGMVNDGFQLFRNLGRNGAFEDAAPRTGLLTGSRQLTGWSLGMVDFDNDGWRDLFFSLSHFPALERSLGRDVALANRVFRSLEGLRFEDVTTRAGDAMQMAGLHHGAAFGDFDNDGKVDVVVTTLNGPAKLLRNTTENAGHWLAVRLLGRRANRQGLGAVVRVTLPDGRVLSGHASSAGGYGGSSEPLVRFGLGAQSRTERVEVVWPGGQQQAVRAAPVDRVIAIEQTEAEKR